MKYEQAKAYYINTTVAPSDRDRLQEELKLENLVQQLQNRPQYSVNYLRLMNDGSERHFRIEFAGLKMPEEKMGIVCGFKDVDQDVRRGQAVQKALQEVKRMEAENRRLKEEARSAAKIAELTESMTSLLTNMPALTFSKDFSNGQYLACNQLFAEFAHRKTPAEVAGLTDFDIFDKVTAAHFVADDQKTLAMDEPYVLLEDVPDAVGNPRHFQTTKMKFTDSSGRLCLLGMSVDISELMRLKSKELETRTKQIEMEEHLKLIEELQSQSRIKEQQERLISALASDYHAVYYLELDKDEGVCYQSHEELEHGLRAGEHFPYLKTVTAYANANITEAYRDEFLRFVQPDALRKGLKEQRVLSYRYMVKRNGQESYEMVRFADFRHSESSEEHIVNFVSACFMDVDAETRKSLAESQALSDALASAEQANRAKTAFLSNMSHEIRTPMNAIIGLNNIAMNDSETSEKTKEYLEKIGISAHHLLAIINDILDMSRIESGRMVIKSEEFSFSRLLEQINTIISGQCRDKRLQYDCHIQGKIDDYYIGDEMKLRQVLINILGNAVKFTESGGTVLFCVEEGPRFDNNTTLRFVIKDTGIGMNPEFIPILFDAFTQEDSSSTNKFGSTGLGMPITKSIVEMMNGNIEVESEKGVGTTFTVTLTLKNSLRKSSEKSVEHMLPSEMNVLVIDDDPIACEHATIVLGQVGIHCDTALSGEEALALVSVRHARREPYDLILVDWKMPVMDGVETTRRIRSVAGKDSAIIILTSYNWDDIVEEAMEAGVDSFVPKPLFAGTVLDEFREAFKKKKEAAAAPKTDLRGCRVLLAEDMVVNAEIMVMVLSMREMDVDVAENGKIAVEMFESHEPGYYDAILMDMRMPEMDGLDATKLIRVMKRPDAQSIPIIALTANAFDEDVQRSMQAGLNAHLSKPVEPPVLFKTLETLIR